jgi:hypothetical protein
VNPFAAAYKFWMGIPTPIREPFTSAVVSGAFGLQTVVLTLFGAAIADGAARTPGATLAYFLGHWWGALLGIIVPAAYRARQAADRVSNTVLTPEGATVTVLKGPPDGTRYPPAPEKGPSS